MVQRGPRIQSSRNEWVFEWLLLWQACCDRITHSVEQIGPWVLAGPRGLSIAPRLRLSERWAALSMAVPWQTLSDSVTLCPNANAGMLLTHTHTYMNTSLGVCILSELISNAGVCCAIVSKRETERTWNRKRREGTYDSFDHRSGMAKYFYTAAYSLELIILPNPSLQLKGLPLKISPGHQNTHHCDSFLHQDFLMEKEKHTSTVIVSVNKNPFSPGFTLSWQCATQVFLTWKSSSWGKNTGVQWCPERHVSAIVMAWILHCSPAAPHSMLFDDVTG